MVHYECETCHSIFTMLSSFQKHMASPTACEKVLGKNIECTCGKMFTTEKSMNNHRVLKNCSKKDIENINDKLREFESMKEELETLKKEMNNKQGRPKKSIKNTHTANLNNSQNKTQNTNNSHNNNTNNVQNIIQTNYISFGHEELDKLTMAQKQWICSKSYGSLKECARLVHCNPNLPEQRNIFITNMKSDMGFIFKDGKLKVIDVDELLDDIILYRVGDLKVILSMEGLNILERHKEKVQELIDSVDRNDIAQIKKIKKELKILIYNENKMNKEMKRLKD
jgi:hypothetical protein